MTVKSKNVVTKLPCGTIYIAGPPKFIGRFPVKSDPFTPDPEAEEMLEELQAVMKAGNTGN
jgi:hypothetical protein